MATFHSIQVQQENLNAVVSEDVSKYSESLRNRLGKITDFKESFDQAFAGFVENALPKDALYKQIERLNPMKKKGGKGGGADSLLGPAKPKEEPLLPNVHVSKPDQLNQKMAATRAAQEMQT